MARQGCRQARPGSRCGMQAAPQPTPAVRKRLLLLILTAALASISGCSRGDAVAAKTIKLTDADNRRALTIAGGDTLVVSLASTPGTGFSWKLAHLDNNVLRAIGAPELIHGSNPMPGAPATQIFRFVAAGTGSSGLDLDYVRPWEHGVAPARTFRLDVTVR